MPRVIATAAFMLALVPGLAQAQLVQQHSFNINGDVVMVGNGLLTCSTTSGNGNSNCAGHQGGTGSNGQNADRDMVYINTDPVGGSAPANSSTATVSMPAGAIVRSAGLYWSGRSGDSNNARRNIHFKVPGGSYQQLTANSADVYTFTAQGDNGRRPYTAYRDVTSLVTASGSYSVGGLTSSIGTGDSLGLFGGWALIITYEHSSKPFRRLMVFNASNALQVSNGNPASATVSGLLTPPAGSFNAYMGALVWEGDDGITGDRFNLTGAGVLGGGSLSDAQSPNNNFWNSRISHLGSLFTGRNPAYANNFAIDLKMVDISSGSAGPRMANNATTADLQFTSTGDVYFPHALVFISDLFSPLVLPSMQKTVSNVSRPGATNVKPGETLEYTIKFGNTGQDGAIRVVLTDPIPAGTTYLPGSLRVHRDDGLGISSATPRSDGSGDDQAEFDTGNNRVVFRVGSGANATTGGMLAQNQQVDLRFRVTVNAGAGPTLTNVATLTHGAQTFPDDPDRTVTGSANTNIPVLLPSITVSKAVNPVSGTPVAPGDTLTYTLTVSVTNGPTMEPLVLTDTLSAQVNNLQVTNLGSFTQGGTATVPTFTLPTNTANGIYTVVYTVDVLAAASGNVGNQVVVTSGGGNPPPDCRPCSTSNPVAPSVTVTKTANPASGAAVVQGDTLTYTLTVVVANGPTTAPVELTDTLSTQVENLQVTNLGSFTQSGTATVPVFTLPVNTANGSYSVTYTVVVKSDATGSVGNSVVVTNNGGDPTPSCPAGAPCTTTHTVNPSSADMVPVFSGLPAVLEPGEVVSGGTLTCTNNGPGSAVGASCVPSASAGTLSNVVCTPATPATVANGGSIVCTFDYTAPGTAGGSDTGPTSVTFTGTTGATNDSNGGTTTGGNNSTTATPPIVDAVDDTTSAPGGSTGNTFDLGGNDQVPPGSTFTLTGGTCANPSLTGSVVTYDATPNPCTVVYQVCAPAPNQTQCDTATLTVLMARLSVVKSVTSIGPYTVGSTISYSFLVTNTGSVTLTDVTVTDGLAGLSAVVCPSTTLAVGANMTCTATYVVTQTDVDAGNVHNSATASGTPPATPTNPNPTPITTPPSVIDTPIAQTPALATAKTATLTVDNGTPGVANIGDVITYHVTVTNTGNMTLTNVVVVDTLDGYAPTTLTCSPTTLAPGQVATCASYTHTVTVEDANRQGGQLDNQVVASATTVGSVSLSVTALGNAMVLVQPDPVQVRIVKTAGVRDVKVGDLVRYTLSIQNTGTTPLVNGVIVDTPPAGFSYVDGSLVVDDADDVGRIVGTWPLSIDGIDIPAGQTATVAYLLRVGAGVRAGIHSNSALVRDNTGVVSNVASADVQLTADPMLDESLILGTVFDDRDADGWQDSAALSGVRVQGGFVASAYVAGSTTVDRGNGAQPEADASSPLLHGIAIGDISGRDSDADPASAHRVVVSQMLHALEFDNDFVLTSHEGVTVRMDAAGAITVERSGMAAKGLTGAAPTVERKVSQVEGGYRVDYVIQNDGVDERGIPGVRIASVEGLLVETDQFGRYHLTGIDGGRWERGRNFILKVDPATVPPGSKFTTENPLLRRVTPGLPVRFDFGVKLPSGMVEGGSHEVELELGEVLFDPESASLRSEYLPVIERMAAQVREHGAGEVVIAANGESQALAYDRAKVVRDALLAILPAELAQATRVSLRSDLADPRSTLVSLGESPLLGTILFDTDKSAIKPEYVPVIEKIAADIEKLGGGVVGVIGHADRRGSDAYNVALGMRRAKAVYEAIAARLGAEARSRLRVEINDDPTAPVGLRDGREVR